MKTKANRNPSRERADYSATTLEETASGVDALADLRPSTVPGVGSRVGRYRLMRKLGEGGMGVVYEALDPELDRMVAIKLLLPGFDNARLMREARALARLSHPNVVTVYDVGEMDGQTFIAMELIHGVNMRTWLTQQERDYHEVLNVLLPAGRGLAAAHAAHLVHRDFKPENVMIGDDGRVRVLDFGIVSAVVASRGLEKDAPDRRQELTKADMELTPGSEASGSFAGTPAYMAPEQLSAQAVDERADQYSYCVVLWEALYGKRPFHGVALTERATGRASLHPTEWEQHGVPLWLHRMLLHGLSANLGGRYPSMEALLSAAQTGLSREQAAARLIGKRYDPLPAGHGDDEGTLLSALDRLTGKVVAIRRMSLQEGSEDPTRARIELAHLFRDNAALRHPNLVGVLDFGFEGPRSLYFVLGLRDSGVTLRAALAAESDLPVFDYLAQILRAISHLHRHRMQAGSLTLEDVFVVDHEAKVLPLPRVGQVQSAPPPSSSVAPSRGGPGVAADLAAFGQLALQALRLRFPAAGALAQDPPRLSDIEVDPKVAKVLSRMQDPNPAQRYPDADAVLSALGDALGRAVASETFQTRESRLRAAPLVGREAEVKQLSTAVHAVARGAGGAWLVYGESGVGKSRLLDEVRTLSLVEGALVLRGQEQSEGASAYHLFRDALRWLALLSDLDELEAGVLLPIVPNVATVLNRPVVPAPELDALSMHTRTCEVVSSILRRQKQPIVLLLEDVQWSRSDSLELLKHIVPLTTQIPLLIVATARNDESPGLRQALAAMKPLDLQRLSQDAVEHLLVAMGGENARRPELVELLWRETEGNAFFVVEVMRALAEESGSVARIGAGALPERVLAGGIRRVAARRLEQVPAPARALLQLAAVAGRTVDFALLANLEPEADLEAWCDQCVEASVLERTTDGVRFAHDKLREGVLAELAPEQQQELSQRVAQALEHGTEELAERYSLLAHHFGKAGDHEKEALYAALSGEQAIRSFAITEGKALLVRALELTDRTEQTASRRAHMHRLLGEASYYEGSFNQALSNLTSTLSRLGIAVPASRFEWVLLLLKQGLIQFLLYLGALRPKTAQVSTARDANEASWAAARAATVYSYDMDMLRALTLSLISVNQVRKGANENPFGLGILGYAAASLKLSAGDTYFRRARKQTLADPDSRRSLADVLHLQASYLISVGRFREATRVALESVAVAEEIGDLNAASVGVNIAAICDHLRGKLPRMLERSRNNQAASDGEHRLLRATSLALSLCELGQPEEALNVLQPRAGDAPPQLRVTRATVLGVTALAHARKGSPHAAWETVQECLRMDIDGTLVPASCSVILTGPLVAILACWARVGAGAPAEVAAYERAARWFLRRLKAYGRACRPGIVMTHYFEGRVHTMAGERRRALRAFASATEGAAKLGMRHYEALAQLELGLAAPEDSETRHAHLKRAARLLTECGIDYEVAVAGTATDADTLRRAAQS